MSCIGLHRPTLLRAKRASPSAGPTSHRVHQAGYQIPRRSLICAAGPGGGSQEQSNQDSDVVYVLKLAAFSFAGAAAIKYGSLLTPLAFTPNPVLATALVFGVPGLYALALVVASQRHQQAP